MKLTWCESNGGQTVAGPTEETTRSGNQELRSGRQGLVYSINIVEEKSTLHHAERFHCVRFFALSASLCTASRGLSRLRKRRAGYEQVYHRGWPSAKIV